MRAFAFFYPATPNRPGKSRGLLVFAMALLTFFPNLVPGQEGQASPTELGDRKPVESELIFEGLGSFGHFHVFAYSWWSYLDVGGIEYDRHSWGRFLGARRDYVAEVLPIAILRQPAKTDVFGDPLTTAHRTNYGVGISPAGVRLIWRDGKNWKPYYTVKGGVIVFAKKSLSEYASYQNFSLQQSIGIQLKVNSRWDFR